MARSPMPRSCFSGVTTPRTMFWSTWSIMMTRPSTHMGHVERADGPGSRSGPGAVSPRSAGAGVAPSVPGSGASSALDGDSDEGAVFGPGAVVVLDVLVAQQLPKHEPGVGRALADAAVGDHVLVGGDAGALVEVLQVVSRLEGAVLVGRLAPGDVRGAGDVPGHLSLLLRQVGRRHQLAAILLGRADVDELGLADLLEHLVAQRPQLVTDLALDLEVGGLQRRGVGDQLAALELPLLAPAVQ